MRFFGTFVAIVAFAISSDLWVIAANEEPEAAEELKYLSPDGRFALRVADLKVDLIETPSGKVMLDLDTLWVDREDERNKDEPVLVWSSDSKWVAYGTRALQSGSTTVYFWDGSAFKELALPAKLPEPKIKPRKGDSG